MAQQAFTAHAGGAEAYLAGIELLSLEQWKFRSLPSALIEHIARLLSPLLRQGSMIRLVSAMARVARF